MELRSIALATGLFLNVIVIPAWAQPPETQHPGNVVINIAGHKVPVVAGGLYDRYRSNPPLSVIAAEAPSIDLSWFKGLDKKKVDMGFESYSPNFFYQNSRVTAIYTADLDRLRELIPAEMQNHIQPIQIWPGRGVVALTAFSYNYCDNDSYHEVALAIATNKPGRSNLGPISLISQSMSDDLWGYVVKLPVNTEIARVRGVVGYNLPKWLTGINRRESDSTVTYEIIDSETGKLDITLETKKLEDLSDKVNMVTSNFTNADKNGQLQYGYAVSRLLSHASNSDADSVKLTLNGGSLSKYIESLKLGKMMKYEYVPDFQSALYAPAPLASMSASD
ncbi:acetoacetate decarboxylase (ADC) [Pseudomonas sp. ADAK13]|uniref:acetoacetate decarboxylase (ADC) n=1 Tax=Pseudomonas sp. ADAK13 TaxID=2730847 RepID=UPI00146386C8|nr:acetoacetate decarboxylase (ADC) [Pseudomonas sp. ADAK13]QJI37097.1 acetoacetate decarboxylase (ADC) [Pseudomonas sp. ADAK13]